MRKVFQSILKSYILVMEKENINFTTIWHILNKLLLFYLWFWSSLINQQTATENKLYHELQTFVSTTQHKDSVEKKH